MVIPQLISFISVKTEIPVDQAAYGARAPPVSPRTVHTLTTHHLVNGVEAVRRFTGSPLEGESEPLSQCEALEREVAGAAAIP